MSPSTSLNESAPKPAHAAMKMKSRESRLVLPPKAAAHAEDHRKEKAKPLRLMLAGGGAGAVAKTCVAPLERIKMLMQVFGMTNPSSAKTPTILRTAKTIWKQEGVAGFWTAS